MLFLLVYFFVTNLEPDLALCSVCPESLFYAYFCVSLHALRALFSFVSKILPLSEVGELILVCMKVHFLTTAIFCSLVFFLNCLLFYVFQTS